VLFIGTALSGRQKNEHFKSIKDLREAGATLLIAARLSRPIGLL
jgi:hypothetical protein